MLVRVSLVLHNRVNVPTVLNPLLEFTLNLQTCFSLALSHFVVSVPALVLLCFVAIPGAKDTFVRAICTPYVEY